MAINRDKVLDAAEKMVVRGRIESAISEYRKLLTDNPKDIALLNKVGDLYIRISRNDEAVRLFLQLAARYSEDGPAGGIRLPRASSPTGGSCRRGGSSSLPGPVPCGTSCPEEREPP